METINRLKNALENFNSPYEAKEVRNFGTDHRIFFTIEELETLKKQIETDNENKISDYNVDNFEKDFNSLMQKIINTLECPSKKNITNNLMSYASKYFDFFVHDDMLKIRLASLPSDDFYFLPLYNDKKLDKKVDSTLIYANPVPIHNSFSDLFLQKLKEHNVKYTCDIYFFFDSVGNQRLFNDGQDIEFFCDIKINNLAETV